MHTLKLRRIGSSIGVILPKELLDKLNVSEGDQLYASSASDSLQLTPYDPDFESAMDAFETTRKKYRNALHKLAK